MKSRKEAKHFRGRNKKSYEVILILNIRIFRKNLNYKRFSKRKESQ